MMRGLLVASIVSLTCSVAAASESVTFPFEDGRYLRDGERDGGLVHFDPNLVGPTPLVVFLHGVNEAGPLHRGLAGAFDVRRVIDDLASAGEIGPLAIAGPSQTKEAWTGSRLWAGFDLDAFVSAIEAALPQGVAVDRTRVILAGHSGAGCNTKGGVLAPRGKIAPAAILALDTCMDATFGKLLGEAAQTTPVHVFYQTTIWPREVDAFHAAFADAMGDGEGTIQRIAASGANPHEEVAGLALRKVLPKLVPADDDA